MILLAQRTGCANALKLVTYKESLGFPFGAELESLEVL